MVLPPSTLIRDAAPGTDDDAVVRLMTDYMTWAHQRQPVRGAVLRRR